MYEMNKDSMFNGVRLFLEGMGLDLTDQHLKGTPERIVRAWSEAFCSGYKLDPKDILTTNFVPEKTLDQMIITKNIPFCSTCIHHLVPFRGIAKIGYIPNKKLTGLSKMARILDMYAKRLQIQESLTSEIAHALMEHLQPKGVGVVLEAEHLCMTIRGVQKEGATTVTSCLLGGMKDNEQTRAEFLNS